jgi:hypothetical protein
MPSLNGKAVLQRIGDQQQTDHDPHMLINGSHISRHGVNQRCSGIPNYPTEDDAARGFMHLVRHREVAETLAQVPPAIAE